VAEWPEDADYWWASYPFALEGITSWETYRAVLSTLYNKAFTRRAPGKVGLWQCSGDKTKLEGFGGHAVDINAFYGTLAECKRWFGIPLDGETELTPEPKPKTNGMVVNPAGLNFRSTANAESTTNIFGALKPQTNVKITGRTSDALGNEWLKVQVEGYIASVWNGKTYVKEI
jgi:hypothetical protein